MVLQAKDERIDLRLTEEHKSLIEEAADLTGQPVSAFLVSTAVSRAQAVIEQHQTTTLTRRDALRFLEVLEMAEPNAALRTAAARYKASR